MSQNDSAIKLPEGKLSAEYRSQTVFDSHGYFLESLIEYVWLCSSPKPTRMLACMVYTESYE